MPSWAMKKIVHYAKKIAEAVYGWAFGAVSLVFCAWGGVFIASFAMSSLKVAPALTTSAAGPIARDALAPRESAPDTRVSAIPLPVEMVSGESHLDMARKLVHRDTFMALALGVEDVPARAYVDAAGANVGAGYCVEMRRRIHGDTQIAAELAQAGFEFEEIESLMSRDEQRVESVKVDNAQALRLLVITKPQYAELARNAVGAAVFDALPSHKQDALAYLSYNTGAPASFVKLIQAVRAGDEVAALSEFAPSFTLGKGQKIKNHRLRAWVQATWIGPDALGRALARPDAFESTYASLKGQRRFIVAHWDSLVGAEAQDLAHIDAQEAKNARPKVKTKSGLNIKIRKSSGPSSNRTQIARLTPSRSAKKTAKG